MRVGYSWPLQHHGGRAWVSFGPAALLVLLPLAAAWWAILLAVWLLHLLWVIGAAVVDGVRDWRAQRGAGVNRTGRTDV